MLKRFCYGLLVIVFFVASTVATRQIVRSQDGTPNSTPRIPITLETIQQVQLLGTQPINSRYSVNPSFTGDGDRIINYGSVWDTNTMSEWEFPEQTLGIGVDPIATVALTADGERYARDQNIRLWHLGRTPADLTEVTMIGYGHPNLVFSPDGSKVAVFGLSDTSPIQIWNTATGQTITEIPKYTDYYLDGIFSPDGSALAIKDSQSTTSLWNTTTGQQIAAFEVSIANYYGDRVDWAFHPTKPLVAYRGVGNQFHLYDFAEQRELLNASLQGDSTYAELNFHFTPSGSTLIIEDENQVQLWATASLVKVAHFETLYTPIFSQDYHYLAIRLSGGAAYEFWDIENRTRIASRELDFVEANRRGDIIHLALSKQGNILIEQKNARQFRLYDLRSDTVTTITLTDLIPDNRYRPDYEFDFTLDETLFITADYRNTRIQFWDIASGQEVLQLAGTDFTLSPDNTTLIIPYGDTMMIYGIPSEGRLLRPTIPGIVPSDGINLRERPDSDSSRIAVISGAIMVAGRTADNEYAYLSSHQGWVRAGPSYIELAYNLPLELVPVIDTPPAWIVAVEPLPTFMPTPAMPISAATQSFTPTPVPTELAETPSPTTVAAAVEIEVIERPIPPGNLEAITAENAEAVRLLEVIAGDEFAFTPNGQYLVVNNDHQLEIWDVPSLTLLSSVEAGSQMLLSSNGETVLSWENQLDYDDFFDKPLWSWDISDPYNAQLQMVSEHTTWVIASPGQSALSFSNTEEQAFLWNPDLSSQPVRLQPDPGETKSLLFSPDGTLLITSSDRYADTSYIWDVKTTELLATLPDNIIYRPNLSFSPDSTLIGFSTRSGIVGIWEARTGHQRAFINTYSDVVEFSADGQKVLTFAEDSQVLRLWQFGEMTVNEIGALRSAVLSFSLSPDSRWLTTVHEHGIGLRLWETQTGTEVATIDLIPEKVVFSPDGRFLAASHDSELYLIETITGNIQHPLVSLPSPIQEVGFSTDGTVVQVTLADQTRRQVMLAAPEQPVAITQDITGQPVALVQAPLGFWIPDQTTSGQVDSILTGYDDESLHFVTYGYHFNYRNYFELVPRFSPDGATLAVATAQSSSYRSPISIMIFGVPTPDRPVWTPLNGEVASEVINLRSGPSSDSEKIGLVFEGPVLVGGRGGRQGDFFYLPEYGGWVRSDPVYITLDETLQARLPTIAQ